MKEDVVVESRDVNHGENDEEATNDRLEKKYS